MADEIERKFLVTGDAWRREADEGTRIVQAHLVASELVSLRVRVKDDAEAVVTIKSARSGAKRSEYEYGMPIEDARELLALGHARSIAKTRFLVPAGNGLTWEIDRFEGPLEGNVLAEIELESEGQAFERPGWLGEEVTEDARYYNARLARDGWPE